MNERDQPKATPERASKSKIELQKLGEERIAELRNTPEADGQNQEKRAEEAREKIAHHAEMPATAETSRPGHTTVMAHLDHKLNYVQTLASVQRRLQPMSRQFSRVIHAPAVEAVSEVLGKTALRPSVTLGATWTAALVGIIFYFTAREYGYHLSGAEIIVSLLLGGLLGLLTEFIVKLLARRK